MNSRSLLIITGLILFSLEGIASEKLYYQDYHWKKEITGVPHDSSAEKEIIQFTEVIEFVNEKEGFFEYRLYHQTERIFSQHQVERSNTKYIGLSDGAALVEASARVIKNDHTEILLDQSDILTSYDEEEGHSYRYFALEGLEPGSVIDIYYVVKRPARYKGVRKIFQREFPVNSYTFRLISPDHLVFAFKVYNDTTRFQPDTLADGKKCWTLDVESVPALIDEDQAPYKQLLKRFIYKMDENRANGKRDFTSYGKVSQDLFEGFFSGLSKSDGKALSKLLKMAEIAPSDGPEEVVRKLEYAVKENINVANGNGISSGIADMVKGRQASAYGITRLMVNLFKLAGVRHEIVLTCDREDNIMDPLFESYHFLQEYLIWFPDIDSYIVPDQYEYRLGIIPYTFTGNNGLFIREVTVGEFTTGLGEVKYIPQLDYKDVGHDHVAQVTFTEDLSGVDLYFEQISTGYYAVYFQAYLDKIDQESLTELAEEMIHGYFRELEIHDWEFKNGNAKAVGVEPLVLACHGTTSELLEYAGNNLLLKVGDLIGPQVEIYSEERRRLPVQDIYKRSFNRTIEVEIPKGYRVRNMDDLRIREEFVRDGNQLMLFESVPELVGDRVRIELNEFYDKTDVSLDEYAEYRTVVNSAADFNKVKLILEKVN
ncbi:MAG: DUF3857 domain-containing protein [Bacteroidota bacterium]